MGDWCGKLDKKTRCQDCVEISGSSGSESEHNESGRLAQLQYHASVKPPVRDPKLPAKGKAAASAQPRTFGSGAQKAKPSPGYRMDVQEKRNNPKSLKAEKGNGVVLYQNGYPVRMSF